MDYVHIQLMGTCHRSNMRKKHEIWCPVFVDHYSSYSAAFKNVFDWTSRIDMKVYQGKPVIMLATSPGPGGASSVLAAATGSAPYFAAEVKGSLSIPSFYDNFDMEKGELKNEALAEKLKAIITEL